MSCNLIRLSNLIQTCMDMRIMNINHHIYINRMSSAVVVVIALLTMLFKVSAQTCGSPLPTATTSIDAGAYHGCASLISVVIPSTVTVIGDSLILYGRLVCYLLTSCISVLIPFNILMVLPMLYHMLY